MDAAIALPTTMPSCSPTSLCQEIADLPSCGKQRTCAFVNRQRTAQGARRGNAKRFYRDMVQAVLLLPEASRRCQSARTHEGRVAFSSTNAGWCSAGVKIKSDSYQTLMATFINNC